MHLEEPGSLPHTCSNRVIREYRQMSFKPISTGDHHTRRKSHLLAPVTPLHLMPQGPDVAAAAGHSISACEMRSNISLKGCWCIAQRERCVNLLVHSKVGAAILLVVISDRSCRFGHMACRLQQGFIDEDPITTSFITAFPFPGCLAGATTVCKNQEHRNQVRLRPGTISSEAKT